MDANQRASNYWHQTGRRYLTSRQRRRLNKKVNAGRAAQRRAAAHKP